MIRSDKAARIKTKLDSMYIYVIDMIDKVDKTGHIDKIDAIR